LRWPSGFSYDCFVFGDLIFMLPLNIRTPYSLAEGALPIKRLAELAQRYGYTALGMCDRYNLFGAMDFAGTLAPKGIQPVMGCLLPIPTGKETDVLALFAQTETGFKHLLQLMKLYYLDDALSLETLALHTDDLLAVTGFSGSYLFSHVLRDASHISTLAGLFPNRLFIGLDRQHEDAAKDTALMDLAYAQNIPLLAFPAVMFEDPSDTPAHDALLCVAAGVTLAESNRQHSREDYALQSPEVYAQMFADVPEALANTHVFAQRTAFMPTKRSPMLPAFAQDEAEMLRQKAQNGLKTRLSECPPQGEDKDAGGVVLAYEERLRYELDVIISMGFAGYFLIVSDFITWAKEHGIPVGPGRGSGAGSLVAWCLNITDLDPLRWNLLFERFLNPERVSMPDFDIDFCQDRRDEVLRYVQQRYGYDRVAQIITFGTLQARAALRDVGRVLGLPYGQVDRICKMVPQNPAHPVTLAEAISSEPALKALKNDEETKDLMTIALKLEGLYRHASTHAAGVVIGDQPLQEVVPLYRDPRSDMPVTQYSMKYVEQAGLVKFDFLGLKTLSILRLGCEMIARETGDNIDLNALPLNDVKTFELLATGQTMGLFQLESAGMREVLKTMETDRFEEIIALVSLYRPGPMDNIPRYVACKHGRENPDYLHPLCEPILKETFGVMIYQEQVMQIAQAMGGYSLGEADLLRRAMGKKIKSEMDQQCALFTQGAKNKGVPEAKAIEVFNQMAKFAGYGFNKSHAAAYALIAYQTAWMKAHYPAIFMAATMSYELSNTDKLALFKQDVVASGLTILPPDVQHSGVLFQVEGGGGQALSRSIRYALAAIKGVGEGFAAFVVKNRQEQGPFKTIFDFLKRVTGQINKRFLENLVASGALDGFGVARDILYHNVPLLLDYAQDQGREGAQMTLLGGLDLPAATPKLDQSGPRWRQADLLQHEYQALGCYVSGHPLDRYASFADMLNITTAAQISDLVAAGGDRELTLAAVITAKKEKRSAKGNRYAFLQSSDWTGSFEVTCFSEALDAARPLIEEGAPLLIRATLSHDDNGYRLIVRDVASLEERTLSHHTEMTVTINRTEDLSRWYQAAQDLQRGKTTLFFRIVGKNQTILLQWPHKVKLVRGWGG
jgi:DNA polymerase-3 subunit alpha